MLIQTNYFICQGQRRTRLAGTAGALFDNVEIVCKSSGRGVGELGIVLDYTINPVGNTFVFVLTATGAEVWYTKKIDVIKLKNSDE